LHRGLGALWHIHISDIDIDKVPTPQLFRTCFYNQAHRLCLEKLLYLELSRSPNGFLNHFWIQVTVSFLKPPHDDFRSETAVT
jgi:hypothetical protein